MNTMVMKKNTKQLSSNDTESINSNIGSNVVSKYSDQAKLGELTESLSDRFEEILDHFGVEYSQGKKMFVGPCPVHGGDKENAFNLYNSGQWVCRTHGCQIVFKRSIIGLIRGLLSHQKYGWMQEGDKTYSFARTIEWILSFTNQDYEALKSDPEVAEKHRFSSSINSTFGKNEERISKKENKVGGLTRKQVRASLDIPAKYYLDRGYSAEILDKFDVGLCRGSGKQMVGRVVIPIYDENEILIGCSGRSINDKCGKCNLYHPGWQECPNKESGWRYEKWKHSKGFRREDILYNYWRAKPHIVKSGIIILVESPGNVWRLEENGIYNSVALFGTILNDGQKWLLDSTGALSIIVIGDNDRGGQAMCREIKEKCARTYRLFFPSLIAKNDVGEMSGDEITAEIGPTIEIAQKLFSGCGS